MIKTDLRKQVEEFMEADGQKIPSKPCIPEDNICRLRAMLIAEEAFEYLEATYGHSFKHIKHELFEMITCLPLKVNLVEIADATCDLDYVSEGARLAYGIDGKPIADEVHRTNMAKFTKGTKRRDDGKLIKPKDWKPPDIKKILENQ